ncbi:peptidylprolyl isomerase [Roseomonas sp. NAR14]|uniref:Parvulin-like PPIase n=1 Tax=Roseomonas acroporae TaxID=2937791 RepID=A0A9X1Y5Z6_9PROT|nr:peptidylprolyl isomerase [Roseomonas acroporae]MCK8782840.1 peptidylprolyl isomerase [Roseomonas acroporae]
MPSAPPPTRPAPSRPAPPRAALAPPNLLASNALAAALAAALAVVLPGQALAQPGPPPGASRAAPPGGSQGGAPGAHNGRPQAGPRGTAAGPAPDMSGANRIVAVVNGDVVSRADVDSRRRLFALNAGLQASPEVLNRLNAQVTRLLVDERLRMQEIQRRRIPVMDEDVADAVADVERRNGLPPGGLVAQIRAAGAEPRVFFDQIRVQIGWARLIRAMLGEQANPSEAEVRDLLASIRARTGQPEYQVSEIFVPLDTPGGEAELRRFVDDIVSQLRSGTPFAVVATQFSQAQTALSGGDLGWVQPSNLDTEVARIVSQMPVGAISNPIRVPGGFQIVGLRQKRLVGRDDATIMSMRQAFWPFSAPLDPQNPTEQQIAVVNRAKAMQNTATCDQVDAANRAAGNVRPSDPGEVRLESINPPPLRQLLAGLPINKASQPIISQDGVMVIAVCSRETRNLAEVTPDQARTQLVRDRAENVSRQLQRDLRRRAQIEMRGS